MGMYYCVRLGFCAARNIKDPREQVSTFEPLGARPVTDRDTVPELGLGSVFPRKHVLIIFILFHFISS